MKTKIFLFLLLSLLFSPNGFCLSNVDWEKRTGKVKFLKDDCHEDTSLEVYLNCVHNLRLKYPNDFVIVVVNRVELNKYWFTFTQGEGEGDGDNGNAREPDIGDRDRGDRGDTRSGGSQNREPSILDKPAELINDGYTFVLERRLNDIGATTAAKYISGTDFILKGSNSLERLSGVFNNNTFSNSVANSGDWETYTAKYNYALPYNSQVSQKLGFAAEPVVNLVTNMAWGAAFDAAAIETVLAISLTNPVTGAVVGTAYILVRAYSTDAITQHVTATLLYTSSSIEQTITNVNREVEVLSRTPQEDLVMFLMRYMSQ